MFEAQMKAFARAIRTNRPQDQVTTRIIKGKGHSKMITHLGSPRYDTMAPIFMKCFGISRKKDN